MPRIGPSAPCFIVAEAGVNHNGDVALAHALIDAAADSGADAVKFQTFRADELVAPDAPKATYQQRTDGTGRSQRDMLRALELPPDVLPVLRRHAETRGILFMSTPFDTESVRLLQAMGLPACKISSADLTNFLLLDDVARWNPSILLSTGMGTMEEVAAAVDFLTRRGCADLVLLHCVSAYPAEPADANLRAMHTLRERFNLPVGYSDHTSGLEIPLAAAALGACCVEKHLTMRRTLPGPDHPASLEPDEFRRLVEGIRIVEAGLGDGVKQPRPAERELRTVARRGLVARRPISAGSVLDRSMLTARRPATGLSPAHWPELVGRRVRCAVDAGQPFSWEMLA